MSGISRIVLREQVKDLLLQPGDTVTIQIDGVGEITNPVIAG